MPCDEAGPGRWRRAPCPSVSIRSSNIARLATPNLARRFTPCALWRWRWPRTAPPLDAWSAIKSIDIGFAVEAEDGVLVPVIRSVDTKPLKELVPRYNELVELAHQRKLPTDATGGPIATVTNFGTFGLTWATPIPLPEQTLVLGMGAARTVPQWDAAKGQFVPVMEANVTLSFDHRVLDGGAAGRLLSRVAQLLGTPEKL